MRDVVMVPAVRTLGASFKARWRSGIPIGARVLMTLIHEMIRRDVKRRVAAFCLGGGNLVALAVERS